MDSTSNSRPTLWLLPTVMSDADVSRALPPFNLEVAAGLRHFAVENVRTARRHLRRMMPAFPIDECTFEVLDKSTTPEQVEALAAPMERGCDMGLMSEAGCPAVADPGARLVALAQRRGWRVMPLVGPSSILMGLMGSGFDGQSFAFAGYLPIDARERAKALAEMVRRVRVEGQTQIFIETPYRNDKLLAELSATLPAGVGLCVASDLTGPSQQVRTMAPARWRGVTLGKIPAIFLIGRL